MNPMKVLYQGINCSTRSVSKRASHFFNRLPHYFFDYQTYEKKRDSTLQEKFDQDNQKYKNDQKKINEYKKEIASRDWKVQEEKEHNSTNTALYRELGFDNREHALIFMNIIKDKCDELDHHPEWTLGDDNVLRIKLTSHFKNNNISSMDYDLAAYITYKYLERSDYNFRYNRTIQRLVSYSFSGIVALLSFALFYYTYTNFKRRNTSSFDFYLARINHSSNEYEKRNYFK
jgi:pterin-4a-carbinolamine dehydratase